MRISGFTIARNACRFGYPLAESIRSLLPLVDEYVVGVGDCDDGTLELVQSIDDPKITVFRSTWDLSKRGGETMSEETNKALDRCTGDWAIYLQADEILHEDELPSLRQALERNRGRAEGLSFRYYHFYGSYDFVQDHPRRFYRRATRVVRTGIGVRSVGDACGFKVRTEAGWRRVRRRNIDLHIYHYGHARPPALMVDKRAAFSRLYSGTSTAPPPDPGSARDVYVEVGHLRRFVGTHPAVMRERIAARDWSFEPDLDSQPPRWLRYGRILMAWPLRNLVDRVRNRFS